MQTTSIGMLTSKQIDSLHDVALLMEQVGGTCPEEYHRLYRKVLQRTAVMPTITPPALPGVRTRQKGTTIQKNAAGTAPAQGRRRGRPRRQNGAEQRAAGDISINDATLNAVNAMPSWSTTEQIRNFVKNEYGMDVLSNHIGVALTRHKKAGRIAMVGPEKGPGKKWASVALTGSAAEQQTA
jgi:hypothetical protein